MPVSLPVLSPIKAIRAKCLDCCGGVRAEVDSCTVTKCALHPFRGGKNPHRKPRVLSEEHKRKLAEGLGRARRASKSSEPETALK